MMKFFVLICLVFSNFLFSLDMSKTEDSNYELPPIEEARIKIFEHLYKNELNTLDKKKSFLKNNFQSTQEHDIYTFPNADIEDAYNAYANASKDELLKRELPKTNKAYKIEADKKNPISKVIAYEWNKNSSKLLVTNIQMQEDELCSKEILEFNKLGKETILKVNYEKYCFDDSIK